MLVIRHVSSSTTSDPVRDTNIVDAGFVIVPRTAAVDDALDVDHDAGETDVGLNGESVDVVRADDCGGVDD